MKSSVLPQKGTRSARLLSAPLPPSPRTWASRRVLPSKLKSSSSEARTNYFAEGREFIGESFCGTDGPSVRLRRSGRAAEQIC